MSRGYHRLLKKPPVNKKGQDVERDDSEVPRPEAIANSRTFAFTSQTQSA
jgi:hypothetical protein